MTSTQTREPTKPRANARIDPRIRDRRIEVQRAAGRRRLRVLLVVMCVVSALGAAYLVVTSPVLDVDRVEVRGVHHLTVAEVRSAARIRHHRALLFVDLGAVARRIERLPWVERVRVRREWPGTVRVDVTEYTPVAFVRGPRAVALIAPNGRVVGSAAAPPLGAVEVRGVRRAPDVGEILAPADAADVVAQLSPALATRVVAIDVTGGGLALDIAGNGEIRLGDASNLAAKSDSALAVLGHLGATHYTYIDVSIPQRPVSF